MRGMRAVLVVTALTTVVAAAVTAGPAASRPVGKAAVPRVTCGAKALTFLFWPNGHNAIPSIGFPSFPVPHMEVYKAAASYPDSNEVAVILFTQAGQPSGGFASSCKPVKSKPLDSRRTTAKTTEPTALTCTFAKPAQLEWSSTPSPVTVRLRALVATKKRTAPLAVSASMTDQPNGSVLRYDPRFCKAAPPPS